ncbi:MAG: hypothetical protein DMD91_28845 [Candidatus Rokuibacteriota bacterium]|nr:MAG: hypothetical protein DMD91_28845 [Candidatus Rokubacteria bacterium]
MRLGCTSFVAALTLALTGIAARPALAQVKLEHPAPAEEKRLKVSAAPLYFEVTRPPDVDAYLRHPGVSYDPAFVEPFVGRFETRRSTGQFGLSGWTAPNPPLGPAVAGSRDVNGWLAFGISVTWAGPPPPPVPPAGVGEGERAQRPLQIGERVRRTTGPSDLTGRVVTFVRRNGASLALVQWSGAASTGTTYEDPRRLQPVSE